MVIALAGEISDAEKMRRWLRIGGAKQVTRGAVGEVYSVHGPKRERESAAGGKTIVSTLLDPRLKLSTRQRATGQCYGAYSEMAVTGGGSSEFMREFVDGGRSGSGGSTERQVQMVRMVDAARVAMAKAPLIRYPIGKPRGGAVFGQHLPFSPQTIIDKVCIYGWTLQALAIDRRWIVERRDGRGKQGWVVPDRQRKALAAHLCDVLDLVGNAWEDQGFEVPFQFGAIEVD